MRKFPDWFVKCRTTSYPRIYWGGYTPIQTKQKNGTKDSDTATYVFPQHLAFFEAVPFPKPFFLLFQISPQTYFLLVPASLILQSATIIIATFCLDSSMFFFTYEALQTQTMVLLHYIQ